MKQFFFRRIKRQAELDLKVNEIVTKIQKIFKWFGQNRMDVEATAKPMWKQNLSDKRVPGEPRNTKKVQVEQLKKKGFNHIQLDCVKQNE